MIWGVCVRFVPSPTPLDDFSFGTGFGWCRENFWFYTSKSLIPKQKHARISVECRSQSWGTFFGEKRADSVSEACLFWRETVKWHGDCQTVALFIRTGVWDRRQPTARPERIKPMEIYGDVRVDDGRRQVKMTRD